MKRAPLPLGLLYPAVVLGAGLLVRAWLIVWYPMIFGSDSITRLVNRDLIVLAHQLPALQASIFYISKISADPVLIRCWMALIGAVAGVGFYYLAADLFSSSDALWAALFFSANPLIIAYSIVPYQEILMLAGLFFAFHFLFTERWLPASLSFAVACLSRYEAWVACPVLPAAYWLLRSRRPVELVKGCLLFGWGPLAWILYNAGLAPTGTAVAEGSISPARFMRHVYIGWITVKNTFPVLLLAGLGAWKLWEARLLKDRRFAALGAFLLLFLVAILFSAHGDPRDPERFVSAREAHLPISAVILLAGLGLSRAAKLRLPLAVAGLLLSAIAADRFVARATAEPDVQVSYRVAQYLDRTLGPDDRALLLAKPVPRDLMQAYLERAFRRQGEAGRRNAQRIIDQIDTSPPDYQRTLVHSKLGRDRLLAALPGDRTPQWIVVWSDFQPVTEEEARVNKVATETGPPVQTFTTGPLTARVYRVKSREAK